MRSITTTLLAWGLFVVTGVLALSGILLTIASSGELRGQLFYLGFLMFSPVGALVASRQPYNSLGWIYCAIGLLEALYMAGDGYVQFTLLPAPDLNTASLWLYSVVTVLISFSWTLFLLSMMLFPTGSFISRRWRSVGWLVVVWHVSLLTLAAITTPQFETNPALPNLFYIKPVADAVGPYMDWLLGTVIIAFIPIFGSVIARFRRARGEVREQIKWVAYVAGLWLVFGFASMLLQLVSPSLADWWSEVSIPLLVASVPVSLGIAILRYRLYDIDIIIRHTLVYGVLSAMLAAVYFGSVVLLQSLLRPLTSEGNDLVIVATTLLIAALFMPLRRRIQAFIDRRFYRRKYDAQKTLSAFSATLRNEVELERLTGELVRVINDTMQPRHVSLWLRKADPERES